MDVVWLHGFPLGPEMWDPQLTRFGGIAPRLIDESADTIDAMADLAFAAADDAGLERFGLVGLSMGGYVALRMLDRSPDRVESLVLASTRAEPDTLEGKAARDKQIRAVGREGLAAATGGFSRDVGDRSPRLAEDLTRMAERLDAEGVIAALRAMRDRPDARPMLARVRVPTLVVVGSEDTLIPPDAGRALERAIPRARLAEIDEAGHFVNLEQPEAFNRQVGAFLEAAVAPPQGW